MCACALFALAAVAVVMQLWYADLRVPLGGSSGDNALTLTVIKGLLQHGWVWTNPDLGAPDGMNYFDFPAAFGDTLHLLVMKAMGIVSDDPVLVVNTFYVLGYPLAAAAAFGVLRALGVRRGPAFVVGAMFALLPFHFWRGTPHLGLSSYYTVPLACWLVFGGLGTHSLFGRSSKPNRGLRGWASWRTAATLVIAVVVGLATLYWAMFTVVLLAILLPVAFLAHRDRALSSQTAIVIVVVLGVAFAQQAPAVIYSQSHGANSVVGKRLPQESEIYGLKMAQLLMPRSGHRVQALSRLGEEYYAPTPLNQESSNWSPYLGLLLGIAMLVSWVLALALPLRGPPGVGSRFSLVSASGVASLAALLMATIGGGSAIFAYLVSPQIRAWDRISVFIAFFAAVALASLLSSLVGWLERRQVPAALVGILLALVLAAALIDQTAPDARPDYSGALASWRQDDRFVAAITATMPVGAKVLELPYMPFPEALPLVNLPDYQLLLPYLHDRKGMKWSYGEVHGRPQDWVDDASRLPVPLMVDGVAAAGFSGIYVDRAGYADGGKSIEAELRKALGSDQEIGSPNGALFFFSLIERAQELRDELPPALVASAGEAVTHPVTLEAGSGLYPFEQSPEGQFAWGGKSSQIDVVNPSNRARNVIVSFSLTGAVAGSTTAITVTAPGGRSRTVETDGGSPVMVRERIRLAAGATEAIQLRASGPVGATTPTDSRERYIRLIDLQVTDPTIVLFRRALRNAR